MEAVKNVEEVATSIEADGTHTPVYLTQQHHDALTGSSSRTHKYGMASLVAAVERHTPTTPTRPASAPRARWASPVQPPPQPPTPQRTFSARATANQQQRDAEQDSPLPRSSNFINLPQPACPSVEYTKKPIGDPPITELNPKSASQQIRLKHRAATLIQRYAGSNWQAAQRTKWLLDVVTHIDKDYRCGYHRTQQHMLCACSVLLFQPMHAKYNIDTVWIAKSCQHSGMESSAGMHSEAAREWPAAINATERSCTAVLYLLYCREYIMDQASTIQHLQQQIEMMQGSYGGALHAAQTKVGILCSWPA